MIFRTIFQSCFSSAVKIWTLTGDERKRFVRDQALKDACASGRAPPLRTKCGHVNWARLFGNDSPCEALTSHYSASFCVRSSGRGSSQCDNHGGNAGSSRPDGTEEFVCDLPFLESAMTRLHLGKSSLGGLTAEKLRQLPQR